MGCAHFRMGCAHRRYKEDWAARTPDICAHPRHRDIGLRALQNGMRTPQVQGKWAACTSEWDAHTPDTRKIELRATQGDAHTPGTKENLGCVHPRHMHTLQAQGRIELRAMRELLQQSKKMVSAGLAMATPEADVFSGNLLCIFLGIYYVFLGICLFIYRVAQAVVRNAQPYALVERAQPRQAAHTSIGPSPQRVNRCQLSECTHQTPRRVLIHKANDPPPRGPKVVA